MVTSLPGLTSAPPGVSGAKSGTPPTEILKPSVRCSLNCVVCSSVGHIRGTTQFKKNDFEFLVHRGNH